MSILDDAAIFVAVIQHGGFSHAARELELSNGMVSRRIAQLEEKLGVTLIKRTTRQISLTPEGEIFWKHAQRMQQELDAAVCLVQSSAEKPKGKISVSAPVYFGREYLAPIIFKFMENYPEIEIDLNLSHEMIDPIKKDVDLVIRGSGFFGDESLKDSSLQMKLLIKEKIGVYAGPAYLAQHSQPKSLKDLKNHKIIAYKRNWPFIENKQSKTLPVKPVLTCPDVETRLAACIAGNGIARLTLLNARSAVRGKNLKEILTNINWGEYHIFAIFPQQKSLPKRTRLLLDFIIAHTKNLQEEVL